MSFAALRRSSLLAPALAATLAFAAPSALKIDPAHSKVGFEVSHLVVSTVEGVFDKYKADLNFDPQDFTKSTLSAEIETESINTGVKKRDDHLRSPDFFDAKKFPKITFKSKKVEKTGDKNFKVFGDLTMKDVTKEVAFDVQWKGTINGPNGPVSAFKATTKVNRKEFNINFSAAVETAPVVGDDVIINLNIEAGQSK